MLGGNLGSLLYGDVSVMESSDPKGPENIISTIMMYRETKKIFLEPQCSPRSMKEGAIKGSINCCLLQPRLVNRDPQSGRIKAVKYKVNTFDMKEYADGQ